jgi:hypothetical protein
MLKEIMTIERFIQAAKKEGVQVSEKEAGVVLGYMEGHDYELGLDETGGVIRNDLAYEVGEEHWERYSISEAILFACEMCADILENGNGSNERMDLIQDDNKILAPLCEAVVNPRGGVVGV